MGYLLKVAICWLLCYLFYRLVLERTTFFRLNRYYLLVTLILGLAMPLARITLHAPDNPNPQTPSSNWLPEVVIKANNLVNQPFYLPEFTVTATASPSWQIIKGIYWLGFSWCILRFLMGMFQLYRMYRQGTKQHFRNYTLVKSKAVKTPFSFFHFLFWPAENADQQSDTALMLRHEETHIRQGHTWDVLLSELVKTICWFNPLAYRYSLALRDVHEYLADAAVLQTATRKAYGRLLIEQSLSGPSIALVNHFSTSQLKKRINMMKRKKSQSIVQLQYALALPLIVGLGILFAHIQWKTVLAEAPTLIADQEMASNSPVVIPPGPTSQKTTQDTLPQEVFRVVEEMPAYPGGNEAMFKFLGNNIKYPEKARQNNQEGIVVIQFIVDKKGKLLDQKAVKGVSPEIDAEALRVVGLMPQWKPGVQKGQKVNVSFNLPIRFKLDDKPTQEVDKEVEHLPTLVVVGQPKVDAQEVFTEVEKLPTYRGGNEALYQYIGNNLLYPKEAKEKGIEGIVYIEYIVEIDGSITNAKILKGIGTNCDQEALRVISGMPKWNPGQQKEKAVRTKMVLPIRFKLDDGKTNLSTTLKVQDFKATPNPSNGLFNLSFRADGKATTVEVFNSIGQKVYNQVLNQFDGYFNGQIDLSKQPVGGYVIRIAQGAAVYSQQVVKE
jgi:TonB family protein